MSLSMRVVYLVFNSSLYRSTLSASPISKRLLSRSESASSATSSKLGLRSFTFLSCPWNKSHSLLTPRDFHCLLVNHCNEEVVNFVIPFKWKNGLVVGNLIYRTDVTFVTSHAAKLTYCFLWRGEGGAILRTLCFSCLFFCFFLLFLVSCVICSFVFEKYLIFLQVFLDDSWCTPRAFFVQDLFVKVQPGV